MVVGLFPLLFFETAMCSGMSWPLNARALVSLLLALGILAQTAALVASYFRRPLRRTRWLENAFELCIWFHLLILSLPYGRGQHSHWIGMIVPSGYETLRYIAAAATVLSACIVTVNAKRVSPLPSVAAVCLTLPFMENLARGMYAWLYIVALLFWLLRGTLVCIRRFREIRTGISALSIKKRHRYPVRRTPVLRAGRLYPACQRTHAGTDVYHLRQGTAQRQSFL